MQGRQLKILKAIVDEYVATEEPVGSKTLATRSGLGVSPATIRNEMAVLEDAGLITQPHTSAGRIPTNKGYRVFVDQLSEVKPLSNPERKAIENFLDGATDLDDVISRTVKLLAQVTKQVAVVQYPSLVKAKVRHIELVLLNSSRLMVILITDTGRVEQRMVELPFDITEGSLADLHKKLNNRIARQSLSNVASTLEGVINNYSGNDKSNVVVIITTIIEMAIEHPEEKVVYAGTSNLAEQGIFNFPYIWHFNTFMIALLKIFFAIIIVAMVGNEYSYNTLKQNLIDGLSKADFLKTKLYAYR